MTTVARETGESTHKAERAFRVGVKVVRGLAITAFALCGPEIGFGLAKATVDGYPAEIRSTESALPIAFSRETVAKTNLSTFLNSHGQNCATAVKTYLPGGVNQAFSSGQAELSLQTSGLCPTQDISIISNARSLDTTAINKQSYTESLEKQLRNQEQGNAHRNELWEWPLFGAAAEVALLFGGIVMLDD